MFAPLPLLALLCSCTLLLFGDRGAVSSSTVSGSADSGIRYDFGLDVAQSGWIYACTMASGGIGLAISAPTAAHFSSRYNALRLVGVGVALAAVGAAGTAAAPTFPVLLAARALCGMGAGPFISLAAPLVDDAAPRRRRSAFLAALFVCLPVGFASGYIWAMLIATRLGWRAVFLVEAGVMAPLAAVALLAPTPNDIKRAAAGEGGAAAPDLGFLAGLRVIVQIPSLLLVMAGFAAYNGALGSFSFYGSKAARSLLSLDASTADLIFGLATVATGALGCLSGGLALDALGPSVRTGLLLCVAGVATAAAALAATFAWSRSISTFVPGFVLGELAMFTTSAPATAVLMWSVPAGVRPVALAVSEIGNHVFGDVPLPPLMGWLQERSGSWRATMLSCTAVLAAAAALFAAARVVLGRETREVAVAHSGRLSDGEEEPGVEVPLLGGAGEP